MKTVNDFYIQDGIAILDGVKYKEEAKVVEEYLRSNPFIKHVKITSQDGVSYELLDSKLVKSEKKVNLNPFYMLGSLSQVSDTSLASIFKSVDKNKIQEEKPNKEKIENKYDLIIGKLDELIQLIKS